MLKDSNWKGLRQKPEAARCLLQEEVKHLDRPESIMDTDCETDECSTSVPLGILKKSSMPQKGQHTQTKLALGVTLLD